jgi:isopenicillin-N epimerase
MAAPSPTELRREYLLDPEVAFLNHGSFGACPRPVFERYQAWQRELEHEPVDFLARRLPGLLDSARDTLATYLGCRPADLAFVQNATTGVNLAARSLDLRPDDEVLATDLEYGACDLAWDWVCRRTGARYVRARIPLPLRDPSELVDALFAAAGDRTRAVFVSHITSATGLVLPVDEILARARALGLLTIVDGAHAPAQCRSTSTGSLRLLQRQPAQWLGCAKGAGFLHVRPEHQGRVDGAIVSWGYADGTTFTEWIEKQGTRDPAAWLTVPDAIGFQAERDWDEVRQRSRRLAHEARREHAARHGTARARRDGCPDGRGPAPACSRRPHQDPLRAPPRRDPHRGRSAAPLRCRLHDARGDRSALSRPRSGA